MVAQLARMLRQSAGIALLATLTACGSSSPARVPFKIYSNPPGAYVVYQVQKQADQTSPWIYLGITPLESLQPFDGDALKRAEKVSLRVMKEGYFDQTKTWHGKDLVEEAGQRKMVFWNPSLVRGEAK